MRPHPITLAACVRAGLAVCLGAGALRPLGAQARTPSDSLSSTERAIARAVDKGNADAIALLQRIVNINSGSMNVQGVRAVGDVLRPELDALGFKTRWVDGTPFHRAGHLIAEHPGTGPRLLLIGHLDTVFEPSSPFQRFEMLADSMARGPGIIDMKGGDVIIIHALKALKQAGALTGLNITVVFHGDEEKSGEPLQLARADLTAAARTADYAIGFEDGAADPKTAVIARRSAGGWVLHVKGTAAHSSQIFRDEVGAGAIFEAARVLNGFRERLQGQQYLTFNPGVALGGTLVRLDSTSTDGSASGKSNVVAASMEVSGDLRTISPEQLASAKATMREVTTASLPHTSSSIEFVDGYPPMAPTEGNRRVLAMYDSASRNLGLGGVVAVDPSKAGAADVSFAAPFVKGALDGIGLSGHDDHTERETADLRMLAPLTKRAALLLLRLSSTPAPPRP
ncbi:MAG: M20/M25/M40 family metallo-hydrolase [Gemmatimonadaceae bacterium]